jgi:hypothetical protein
MEGASAAKLCFNFILISFRDEDQKPCEATPPSGQQNTGDQDGPANDIPPEPAPDTIANIRR